MRAAAVSPTGYGLVRRFARLVLGLFYRRLEIVGLERLPAAGPLIVAANHQNGLVDGLALVALLPRPLSPLAKAPLFAHPLIGSALRLLGALPVHRRQEGGIDPARNQPLFAEAAARLGAGGAILIFPEGLSQPEPALQPLRTGVARMLLEAEAAAAGRLGVRLVPVGLVFHEPATFRAGWGIAVVGEPVPTADLVARHRAEPEAAVRELTARLATALRGLMVEAGDRETLRLVDAAVAIWADGREPAPPAVSVGWRQRVARAYAYLREREPERAAAVRAQVARYAEAMELLGPVPAAAAPRAVLRYAAREGLALILGLPLALWGLASHGLPVQLTRLVLRLARPEADVAASWKIIAGSVLFPACWALEGWVVHRLAGPVGVGAFLAGLAPGAFFALGWSERLQRLRREGRALAVLLADRDLGALLAHRRRALREEMEALLARVPAGVLEAAPAAEGRAG